MKYLWIILTLLVGGCAYGEKQALAVLAVSVDEQAYIYAAAKKRRLVFCGNAEDIEAARKCMGPYFGDRGTKLLESIVAAQKAMTVGVEALEELKGLTESR